MHVYENEWTIKVLLGTRRSQEMNELATDIESFHFGSICFKSACDYQEIILISRRFNCIVQDWTPGMDRAIAIKNRTSALHCLHANASWERDAPLVVVVKHLSMVVGVFTPRLRDPCP